jgi:hypothetical protein
MPRDFSESDWKTLSHLKPLALERLCQRIFQKADSIIAHAKKGGHYDSYLDLYRHIQENEKVIGDCFNHWSRFHALDILINLRSENLLTEEEFSAFSSDTRTIVDRFLKRV